MRYLLALSVLLSFVLFTACYITFQGFHFEGLPQGSTFGNRDVSGIHYRGLLELCENSLEGFDSLVFRLKVQGREWVLRRDRDYFVEIDRKKLLREYRNLKYEYSLLDRIKNHWKLSFQARDFPRPFQLEEEKTRTTLKNRLSSLEAQSRFIKGNQLVSVQTSFDFDSCLSEIRAQLLKNKRGLVELGGSVHEQTTATSFSRIDYPFVPVLEVSQDFGFVSRSRTLITSLLNDFTELTLNPNDEFSFVQWVESQELNFNDFELQSFESNGLEIHDFHGLTRISSLLYEVFLKLGFEILEHENHPSLHPELSYLKPGLDAFTGPLQDLRVRNSLNDPVIVTLSVEDEFLICRVMSLSQLKVSSPEIVFRQVQYAPILSVLDPELSGGVKEVVREPLSGLYIRMKGLSGSSSDDDELEVVYEPIDGLIRIGQGGLQIFESQTLESGFSID